MTFRVVVEQVGSFWVSVSKDRPCNLVILAASQGTTAKDISVSTPGGDG